MSGSVFNGQTTPSQSKFVFNVIYDELTNNSRYFRKILFIFASPPFYTTYVRSPNDTDDVSSNIRNNPKFWPYFKDAIGAIDGSHIHARPSSSDRPSYRNRKGFVSQNCLFACTFNLKFSYALTGWEGSATDARLYDEARSGSLYVPPGKYFLADAGFPLCDELLVPYRSVRYHLAEWGRANLRYVLFILYFRFFNNYSMFADQQPKKSSSICDTHPLEM